MGERATVHDHDADTVGDLVQLIDRVKKCCAEAGRPDLADHCKIVITGEGDVRLNFAALEAGVPHDETVEKALSLDPVFRLNLRRGGEGDHGE